MGLSYKKNFNKVPKPKTPKKPELCDKFKTNPCNFFSEKPPEIEIKARDLDPKSK